MRLLFLSLILLLIFQFSYSQTGKIKYIFADKVEVKLDKYIRFCLQHEPKADFYLKLSSEADSAGFILYKLNVILFDTTGNLAANNWVKRSTRYAIVNDHLYPLLFDYDYIFSTPKENEIGQFEHRDGDVARVFPIYHHTYQIAFHLYGNIVSESKY